MEEEFERIDEKASDLAQMLACVDEVEAGIILAFGAIARRFNITMNEVFNRVPATEALLHAEFATRN